MSTSVRSYLLAGFTAVAVSIIAIPSPVPPRAPVVAEVPHVDVRVAPRIDLAASVRSLVTNPPNPAHVAAATAAIARIDPAASKAAVARQPALRAAVTAAVAAPQNAASNTIDAVYQSARNAVTYGVQLASYALQFIPYGYLISDQINIFYYNLGLPIADSIVYELIDPVVNDPLNPAVYVNGLINVGQTSVNAAVNTGIAEFNNFFGWLIPPLPPIAVAAVKSKLAAPLAVKVDATSTDAPTASAPSSTDGTATVDDSTTTKPTETRKAPRTPKTVATDKSDTTETTGTDKSHERGTKKGTTKTEPGSDETGSTDKHSKDKKRHPAHART
jgi:hypothetical protein